MELTITKEKVLEAASKCETAKATLKVLFPEVFNQEKIFNEFRINAKNGEVILKSSEHIEGKIYLSPSFNWLIERGETYKADEGSYYLTPTKK